jgi:hypothetical protein
VEERHGVNSGPIAPESRCSARLYRGPLPAGGSREGKGRRGGHAGRGHLQHLDHRPRRGVLFGALPARDEQVALATSAVRVPRVRPPGILRAGVVRSADGD